MEKTISSSPRWGNNVKKLMDIHGKDVSDMADELGVTKQAIRDIINKGVHYLSAERAAQFQSAFGDIDYHLIFPLITSNEQD